MFQSKEPISSSRNRNRSRNARSLQPAVYARSIVAFTPTPAIIEELMAKARTSIEGLASTEKVIEIFRHNPECISVFARGGYTDDTTGNAMGFLAFLPLTEDGHAALFDGRLATGDPDLRFICRQHERPAAVYHWGVMNGPETAGGIAHVFERMTSAKYRGLPMYCRAANERALQFFLNIGFVQGATFKRHYLKDLMHLPMQAPPVASYDSYVPGVEAGSCGIKVVHDMSELTMVLAMRAAAYIGEQGIPYREDVDGNDLSATHLIGYVGDEPAGCVRIRWFAGFAKVERLAVLPRFRRTRLAFKLVQAAIDLGRAKGYTHFYGHAAADVAPLWERFGFVRRSGEGIRYLTDTTYFEGDLIVPAKADALTPQSGPAVLIRPEGRWHEPSHLEGRIDT